ncbi:type II secretory pathway, component PulC [Gynuella sunshinyii YC6258]|uniref:Type II secretory pathway, component PulC n=1 Tax=Gynuella sunshinyii YC6258 TaxID=1445510 RepID=A0A0C5W1H4_9GAMM|nr:type II secretory pathway, component PulC [Gynuella sunshinyii YC6258]
MVSSKLVLTISSKLMPWLIMVVVVLAARWAALATWAFISPPPEVLVPVLKTDSSMRTSNTANDVGSRLPGAHLFGEAKEEVPVETAVIEDAPDTRLSLELQGVFATEDPMLGTAVIAKKKADGEYFHVNDDIFGQAKLVQVFEDRVILERNRQHETLRFEERPSDQTFVSSGRMNDDIVDQRENDNSSPMEQAVENMVSSIRDEAMNDPQGLVNRMGLEVTDDGYRVTRRARQLMALGLRAGDVVVAVNDNPVGNISQDQSMVDQVIAGGDVKIEIQRGSRRFTIYHSIPRF